MRPFEGLLVLILGGITQGGAAATAESLRLSADETEPAFESATVSPNTSGQTAPWRINFEPGGAFTATNVTLRQLAGAAYRRYGFDPRMVTGGPAWVDTDRFDVSAKAAGEHVFDADGYPRHASRMLQRLLREKFKLEVRPESTDAAVYALSPVRPDGSLGPGLTRSAIDCPAFMARMIKGERPAGGPQCGFGPYPRRLVGRAVTMPDLAGYLSMVLKRPVLDRTNLAGNFDLEVEGVEVVQPGPPGPSTRPSDTTRSIVDMLPEQLGLKLVETRAPVEALIIKHAERPRPR